MEEQAKGIMKKKNEMIFIFVIVGILLLFWNNEKKQKKNNKCTLIINIIYNMCIQCINGLNFYFFDTPI